MNSKIESEVLLLLKMTVEALQKALEEYPDKLRAALERLDKARRAYDKAEEQADLRDDVEESGEDGATYIEREKLDLQYEAKKAQLEMNFRQNPPTGNNFKMTESAVYAFTSSNPELVTMKMRLIEMEGAKREKERLAHMTRASRPQTLRPADPRLDAAEEERDRAESELEVLKSSLKTYKMLTAILAPR